MNRKVILTANEHSNLSKVSTAKLLKVLRNRSNISFIEMDIVPELVKRGEGEALATIYNEVTKNKFAKVCIRRQYLDLKS